MDWKSYRRAARPREKGHNTATAVPGQKQPKNNLRTPRSPGSAAAPAFRIHPIHYHVRVSRAGTPATNMGSVQLPAFCTAAVPLVTYMTLGYETPQVRRDCRRRWIARDTLESSPCATSNTRTYSQILTTLAVSHCAGTGVGLRRYRSWLPQDPRGT